MADLVAASGVSRRTVETVLRALEQHLEAEEPGSDRVRIAGYLAEYATEFGGLGPPARDPWDEIAQADPQVLAEAAEIVAGAPAARHQLDQVPATPLTVLKRGHFLRRQFELRGARILCVGDHDLTSLGVFLAGGADGLRVDVVDADEALIEYIDRVARRRGFDVRCYFSDLRLGLPPALRDSSQLVFTDPPYTPEGVGLFVARGLQGLADQRNGRILLAYGFGDQQPALGLAVQKALNPLQLAYEAVPAGFQQVHRGTGHRQRGRALRAAADPPVAGQRGRRRRLR